MKSAHRLLLVLVWFTAPFLLIPSSATATGLGEITGQVSINSEPTAGAVVFLRPQSTPQSIPRPPEVVIRQQSLRFVPDFLVVPAGTTIRFENEDDEIHNTYSHSTDNRFDTGAHLPGTVKRVVLQHPGVVPIRCHTHQEMRGLIIVSPSPYFSVTDARGAFSIRDIPFGHFLVSAWHPRLTPEERAQGEIDLNLSTGKQTVQLRFTAKAAAGTDLTEAVSRDWTPTIEQIRSELASAILLWNKGSITAATTKVMSTQSRLYGESGLRDAIIHHVGKARTTEHDQRLDAFRKRIQGIETEGITGAIIENDAASIVTELMKDAKIMSAP